MRMTRGDLAKAAGKVDSVAGKGVDAARLVDDARSKADEVARIATKFEQPCSFGADTLVSTLAGQKPIYRVQPGDLVLAYNESAQARGYYTVTSVFAHLDPVVVKLTIGGDIVQTTPEHPFYAESQWVPASDLIPGDRIISASGEAGAIQQVQTLNQPQVMYNLTVAKAHTYFVGPGEWLVHNACSRVLRENLKTADQSAEAMEAEGVAWQAHHLIPKQYEGHLVVQRAKLADGEFDSAKNGVALPYDDAQALDLCKKNTSVCLPTHRGSHASYSNNEVGRRLHAILFEADNANPPWTPKQYKDALDRLTGDLKGIVLKTPAGQRLN